MPIMNTSVGYIGCYGAGEECDINRSNVLDLLHVKIAITLPYLPLLVLAVGGNLLVCKTILSRMRPSVTHFFLLNLSLTDILSTFAVIPMTALADLWFVDWPFGDFMCRLVPFIQCLTIQSTSLTYVIISCDRFALVFRPLRWRRKLSLSRGRLVIMLVWLLAAFQGIPLFLVNELVISEIGEANELEDKNNRAEKNPIGIGNYTSLKLNGSVEALCFSNLASKDLVYSNPNSASVGSRSAEASSQASGTRVHCQETWTPRAGTAYGVTLMTLQYVLPLCLIISSYAAIVWRLWGQSAPGECDVVRDKRIARSRRKMVKMMLTVTLLYAISQLPRHVVYLYGTFVNWCRAGFGLTWHLVILISSSASCYNPFVYAWMNPTYRIGFITALGRLCPSELQRRYQIRTVAKSRMHKLYTADDIIGNGNSIGGPDGETNLDTYVVGDRGQEGCAHGQKHSTGYDLQVTLINRDTIDEVELASETEKAASPVVNKVK